MAEIYLAGGCFWGLEEYFSRSLVARTDDGGLCQWPDRNDQHQLIKETDPRRAIQVIYDPGKITHDSALLFPGDPDPASVNKAEMIGTPISVGVQYTDQADRE